MRFLSRFAFEMTADGVWEGFRSGSNNNSTRNKKALSISEKTEDFNIENLGISKKTFIYFTINKNKKQVLNFWCVSC